MYVNTCACKYISRLRRRVRKRKYTQTHTHTVTHMHTNTHTHKHTHPHTHTQTHTHKPKSNKGASLICKDVDLFNLTKLSELLMQRLLYVFGGVNVPP